MFVFEEMEKMKKVLTILAVLIVLTSAVFAASEVHTIRVKADVTEVVPAFQLWLGETKINATKTNATPVAFTDNATYNLVDDGSAIDTGFNLDAGGSVTVYAVLANKAKINKAYTLTFSDGVFAVTRNGAPGSLNPTIAIEAGAVITGTSAVAKTVEAANAPVQVTFNGTTVTATDPKLATATYNYTGDPTIDPTAEDEYYYANIVLTVATV